MNITALLLFLVIGGVAGYLAGLIMKGRGMGVVMNIVVGVIGAFLGGWLLGLAGFQTVHIVGQIISATVGAVVLLFIARLIR